MLKYLKNKKITIERIFKMDKIYDSEGYLKTQKVYEEPKDVNKKIEDIEEKLEIAKKQAIQRLCIPFTAEEMKKLETTFNYCKSLRKRTQIASYIKDKIMKEVEELMEEMKKDLFKE